MTENSHSKPPKSPCPAEEVLVQYAEGLLTKEERAAIAPHLAYCEECCSLIGSICRHTKGGTSCTDADAKEPRETKSLWNKESALAGVKLGRYVMIQKIGAGGMGEVHSAYDPELDRKIALKLVHAEFVDEPGGLAGSRLLREAQAMAKLSHPNVIMVYDVQAIENDLAIAMEFIDGMTLGK